MKTYWTMSIPLIAAIAAFGAVETHAAAANPNMAGTFKCGPDAKVCQWSGATFTVTQTANQLQIKNEKGDQGTAQLTSPDLHQRRPAMEHAGRHLRGR